MAEVLDSQTRIDDLLFITSHLIDILEQENTALAHNRIDLVHSLVDQKTSLSRAYEIRVLGLTKSMDGFDGIDPALLEKLKQQGVRIEELIEVNAKELNIGIEVGRRFMDVLSESVKTATPSAGTYSASGVSGIDAVPRHLKTSSIAINEQL